MESQHKPSEGEQEAEAVRVQAWRPWGSPGGTQHGSLHWARVPQSHCSQPSTTPLPQREAASSLQQVRRGEANTCEMLAELHCENFMLFRLSPRLPVLCIR